MIGLVVIVAMLVVYGVAKTARARINSQGVTFGHGALVLAWRWLSGQPWHGKAITDAGWSRGATRALTTTGHARRFWHLPRRRRAVSRSGRAVALLAALYGLIWHRTVTLWLIALTAIALAAASIVAAVRATRRRKHHRAWYEPLHRTLAPHVGHPLAIAPRDWLAIEPDRSRAVLTFPDGAKYSPAERREIESAASERLGMPSPDYRWRMTGPVSTLTITRAMPPPSMVHLADIADAIGRAKPSELVLGIGARSQIVSASLALDSPHWGVSAESGAGKSTTCRLIMAQHAHRGGIIAVLDYKRFSHQWAKGMPNVAYARDPAECHDLLLWLQGEVQRRNRLADISADIDGTVHAKFPRILVVGEELNALIPRLRSYWLEIRPPGSTPRSPAIDAIEELGFLGRQVRVNLLLVGQRLSVRATSGDLRENLGVRILSNPSAAAWRMLAERFPQPPPDNTRGRAFVVTDKVTEVQVAYVQATEAREHAMAGEVTLCPAGMPFVTLPAPEAPVPALAGRGADLRKNHVSGPDGSPAVSVPPVETVTLREAVSTGLISSIGLAGLRTARHRGQLPAPAGYHGDAQAWLVTDLIEWEENRSRT